MTDAPRKSKLQVVSSAASQRAAVSRRHFVLLAAAVSPLFHALAACGDDTGSGGAGGGGGSGGEGGGGGFDLPTLGGAPDTPEGRAIAAFVDTVVPGQHRDPTGAPGGIDVGAPALFFDPELPAAQYVNLLVLVLDSVANLTAGRSFVDCTLEERDAVVEAALADEGTPLSFAVQLAKLAYFSAPAAGEHLGYPGPNQGYVEDADFSFGVAMSQELTSDGNLP